MSTFQSYQRNSIRNCLFDSLTDSHRRRVLATLRKQTGFTTERELAAQLAAAEQGQSVETVSPEDRQTIRSRLRHIHLPKLDDVGLVTWNESDETVMRTDHPVHDSPQFQQIIETEDDGWDTVVAALANERRCIVLAILESQSGSIARADIAHEVATREAGGEPSTKAVDEVGVQLHHVHLPKLKEAGLVEYDSDEKTVVYQGHNELPSIESSGLSNR